MIITQTPLRVSFAGGGTDFADFYREHGGAVLSSSVDKFIYVIIKARFDRKIRVGYTRTEMVDNIEDIEHELVRECLRMTGITQGVEIATMADIPSEGSGLGSSSTVTVGLLHAMHVYQGELVTAEQLAREACKIEIEVLGKPIGKQDQYIAAYGGLRRIVFNPDDSTDVIKIDVGFETERQLSESLMLFYTGVTRQADSILAQQKTNIDDQTDNLLEMRGQVDQVETCLRERNFIRFGRILHAGWERKKRLAAGITSDELNSLYERSLDAGAIGGKIAGAGGGGFLLLLAPPDRQAQVREVLSGLRELHVKLERDGSKVIFNNRRE